MKAKTFREKVLEFEAQLIADALKESGNNYLKAARLLGFQHHQSLLSLLNGRHKALRTKPKYNRARPVQNAGAWHREAL